MHFPVLLNEVISYVKPKENNRVIDGTAGGGGYIEKILSVNPEAKILAIDWDQISLNKLKTKLEQSNLLRNCTLVHGNFADLEKIIEASGFKRAKALILDLGFSSLQLDDPERGFSFQHDGPLDMRLNKEQEKNASYIINSYSREQLAKIFWEYGEEKQSKKIANEIVVQRDKSAIIRTVALHDVIKEALPKPIRHKADDAARRIFQALRIEVNSELDSLKKVLPQISKVLEPGASVAIITFHSLEDRIVKQFFVQAAKGCVCPPDFPECRCGSKAEYKILTKKPITAGEQEITQNSRSKSAKLRVYQKI